MDGCIKVVKPRQQHHQSLLHGNNNNNSQFAHISVNQTAYTEGGCICSMLKSTQAVKQKQKTKMFPPTYKRVLVYFSQFKMNKYVVGTNLSSAPGFNPLCY